MYSQDKELSFKVFVIMSPLSEADQKGAETNHKDNEVD